MSFFDKSRIDEDRVSEIASNIADLASNVESMVDDLESYKSRLESIQSDLEDARTEEEVQHIANELRKLSVPDGYDDGDGSPDGVADELDEIEKTGSEYEKWQEDMQDRVNSLSSAINSLACGKIIPSQKRSVLDITKDGENPGRIVGVREVPDTYKSLPYSGETDAWRKSVRDAASKAALAGDPSTADQRTLELVNKLLDLAVEFASYRDEAGNTIVPRDKPVLALMWLIDDILQGVNRNTGNQSRVVVTSAVLLQDLHRRVESVRETFEEGCEKIDESVPQGR